MKRLIRVLLLFAITAGALAATKPLPTLGTQFHSLPEGTGKPQTEEPASCHSADMLVQQRLTEKQWTATVEKMMRWGAKVPEKNKPAVIAYLARNFGTANTFKPMKTKPVGH